MSKEGRAGRSGFSGLLAKAFILATVAALILPMPRYAQSLGQGEYVIWLARLVWVVLLTALFVAVPLGLGFWSRRRQEKKRNTGP